MNICQSCGVVLKDNGNRCLSCGNFVTISSASRLGLQQLEKPLALATQASAKEFERFVSERIPAIAAVSEVVETASKVMRSAPAIRNNLAEALWDDPRVSEYETKLSVVREALSGVSESITGADADDIARAEDSVANRKERRVESGFDSFLNEEPDEYVRRGSRRFEPVSKRESAQLEPSEFDSTDEKSLEIKIRLPKFLFKKAFITIAALLVAAVTALVPQALQQCDFVESAIKWSAALTKPASAYPKLSGKWTLTTATNNQKIPGTFSINQGGSVITGLGHDSCGDFRINGRIDEQRNVQFQKEYFGGNLVVPIKYTGTLRVINNTQILSGTISATLTKGGLISRPVASISGDWQAQRAESSGKSLPAGLEQTYMICAGVMLAFCLGLVWLSYYLFNPNGKFNIWEKEKYIPSQFRDKHAKAVRTLAKPLRVGGVPLGRRCEWKPSHLFAPKDLAIPPAMREANPHMLIVGTANKGKTRLMASMVAQDILARDRAVVVIDTEGTLTDLTMRWIAAHRQGRQMAQRVIVIDPTVKGCTASYNPLFVSDDDDLHTAAAAIVQGFKSIYTESPGSQSQQWSQQTANILRNAALLLMANKKTLLDLTRLLQDNDFRDVLLDKVIHERESRVEYESLIENWDQYKRLARTDSWITWVEPILNRIGQPLGDPRIRPIFAQSENQLDLTRVITDKKVLLVRIPQGKLDQNATLLGSLLVTGLRRAASEIRDRGSEVEPTALYLDEFDSLIEKDTLANITSENASNRIGLIGATKTLQQFPDEMKTQLTIKIGTTIAFAVTKKDADLLGPQIFRVDGRKFKSRNMSNILNPVNSTPQYELISDELSLNVDRMVGMEAQQFFCYREGLAAGVFKLKAHQFANPSEQQINRKLIEKMRRSSR